MSVLEFKNQITPITHSWWAQFQSSAHTVLIVIMGWIQFSQIAKEASWHYSSLYLIQGLVHSVTSHTAKWWFLHSLLITRRTRVYGPKNRTSLGVSATVALPFPLFQRSFAARGNPGPFPILAQSCWKFFKGCVTSRTLLMFHCFQYWMEAFVWVYTRHEGGGVSYSITEGSWDEFDVEPAKKQASHREQQRRLG